MKKLGVILVLSLGLCSCKPRTVYCLPDDKCVTVWKKLGGVCYVIPGKYYGMAKPSDSYVKTTNGSSLDIIWISSDSLLIIGDEETKIYNSTNDSTVLINYDAMRQHNDSLYTSFDGRYPRYKNDVNYISINIKEGYAKDKAGRTLR